MVMGRHRRCTDHGATPDASATCSPAAATGSCLGPAMSNRRPTPANAASCPCGAPTPTSLSERCGDRDDRVTRAMAGPSLSRYRHHGAVRPIGCRSAGAWLWARSSTCWPSDAVTPGLLRHLVQADMIEDGGALASVPPRRTFSVRPQQSRKFTIHLPKPAAQWLLND